MIAVFYLLILFAITLLGWLPIALTVSCFIFSGLTFLLYGLDKLFALKDLRRISEKTLHALSLIGGWSGAYVGQLIFRHKISKQSFRRRFYLTVFVNVAAMSYFLIVKYQQGLIVLVF